MSNFQGEGDTASDGGGHDPLANANADLPAADAKPINTGDALDEFAGALPARNQGPLGNRLMQEAAQTTKASEIPSLLKMVQLPSGNLGFEEAAGPIFNAFAERKELFTQDGRIVEVSPALDDSYELVPLTSSAFRSRLELLGKTMAWRSGENNQWNWRPARCSEDSAKALMATRAALRLLPPISTVAPCPVVVVDEYQNFKVLTKGYHKQQGGLMVTSGAKAPDVPLAEATNELMGLLVDFGFVTDGDASRAVASLITPALVLGGLLGNSRAPLDLALATESQSGKTFRHRLLTAIYGATPYVVAQKQKGVGGLEESFSHGLLSGKPFIQIDNVRGEFNSQYIEAFMTATHIGARIPHRAEVSVNPTRFFVMISSNQFEPTVDLLNRANVVRIRKRQPDHKYREFPEGDVLAHVKANQPYYLGCVFSVIRAWVEAGRPRSNDTRHNFRAWAQSVDWMVQKLFDLAPAFEGYEGDLLTFVNNPDPVVDDFFDREGEQF